MPPHAITGISTGKGAAQKEAQRKEAESFSKSLRERLYKHEGG